MIRHLYIFAAVALLSGCVSRAPGRIGVGMTLSDAKAATAQAGGTIGPAGDARSAKAGWESYTLELPGRRDHLLLVAGDPRQIRDILFAVRPESKSPFMFKHVQEINLGVKSSQPTDQPYKK